MAVSKTLWPTWMKSGARVWRTFAKKSAIFCEKQVIAKLMWLSFKCCFFFKGFDQIYLRFGGNSQTASMMLCCEFRWMTWLWTCAKLRCCITTREVDATQQIKISQQNGSFLSPVWTWVWIMSRRTINPAGAKPWADRKSAVWNVRHYFNLLPQPQPDGLSVWCPQCSRLYDETLSNPKSVGEQWSQSNFRNSPWDRKLLKLYCTFILLVSFLFFQMVLT